MVSIPRPPRPPRTPHTPTPHTPSPHTPSRPHTGEPPSTGNRPRGGGHSGGDNTGDVQRSSSKFKEFVDTANSVVDLINNILGLAEHIPFIGELIEKINNLLRKMFEKVNEAIQKTAEIFAYVGSPTTLRQTGISWVQSVGTPATVATSTIITSSLPSTGHWEGAAHNAYTARVKLQQPASDSIYAKCTMIDDQLNTFADAIVDFWVAFALGVLTLAIGVASSIVEITSVVGAPVGIGTIIIAVLSFISDVVNLVSVVMTANQAAADFMTQVTNELGSVGAFPGAAWPRHTAA
ncbi:hypothetical protein ACUOFU_05990 [Microbacterium arabinogalactanolyticum]|uniref:hypothetical protein n=1 Tax=Microbacterium arabinogalactanolyticum TaxID=69365 RepID=UPI004044DCFE